MTAATSSADSVFRVERQERLFSTQPFWSSTSGGSVAISPTGDHFYMVLTDLSAVNPGEEPQPRMFMIQNFFTELKEKMGGGR